MNFIWEMLLKADKKNISRKNIKFKKAKVFSPYMEIAFDELNNTSLPENNVIEVNECYRFYEIFKELFNFDLVENQEFREVLLDILLHYLAELDLRQGLNKTEFRKKFLLNDISSQVFGEKLAKNILYFENDELDTFLNGLITLYNTGISIELFKRVLKKIFKKSIVYSSKEKPKNIYIYLDEVKKIELEIKVSVILETFLQINMKPILFWDKHFGIIGINNTMRINETVMIE
ncbi:hypothetical protein [uncultured Clostridium sp.]|uniref:hypothetical protein n=1 Tax=uncultured Clostridium sp. TaxID=59620 RepID=UPI0028EC3AA0|nr:hypothetical protein [uncultured Clostridium sp.]